LRYQPNPDGIFLLYSVGLDGKDDGGKENVLQAPPSSSAAATWLSGRDWIWPQPATSEAVESYNRLLGDGVQKRFLARQRESERKAKRK